MVSNLVVEIAIYNFDLFHYTLTNSSSTISSSILSTTRRGELYIGRIEREQFSNCCWSCNILKFCKLWYELNPRVHCALGNVCTSVYHVWHYKWSRLLYKMWPNTFWIQIRSLQISKYITLDTLSLYEYWLVKPHLHLITIEVWIKSLLIAPSCANF